jgi:hypothetical protein
MPQRTQITLPGEDHRKAKQRAAELGISLAEYLRRLVARDLGGTPAQTSPEALFDLGGSGAGDVASSKDVLVGAAIDDRAGGTR